MNKKAPTKFILSAATSILTGLLVAICFIYIFLPNPVAKVDYVLTIISLGLILGLVVGVVTAYFVSRRIMFYPNNPLEEADAKIFELNDQLTEMNYRLSWSNYQLKNILQNLEDGVIAIRNDGGLVILTERAQVLLGEPQPSNNLRALGPNYAQVAALGVQMKKKIKAQNEETMRLRASGETVTEEPVSALASEIKINYPEERILEIYTAPFTADDTSEGVLFVIKDVTLIRHLEQIRTEFVSNVTHELKTPLTSIQGYLELLIDSERDLMTRQQFYQIMEIETDRLKNLIEDLLNLSEIEQAGLSEHAHDHAVNLYEVVEDIIGSLTPQAEQSQVTVYNQLPVDLTFVASPIRMRQLFTNLISNAIKYNKEGGSVWISSSMARNRLELVVRDNGLGIPKDQHERLFERFFRVHKERSRELGGTGLGLSIVKHIVNLYDGTISLDSEPNKGTSFIILFPLI